MTEEVRSWIEFWDQESLIHEEIWRKNMEIFVRKSDPILHYHQDDIILDIGCGKGHLTSFLKEKVKAVHCLDTSARNIELCKKKFADDANIFCHTVPEDDYLNFTFLPRMHFSKIICLSVVQYYADITEIKKLAVEVAKYAKNGAKFLIADIPAKQGLWHNIVGDFKAAIKEKFLWQTIKTLCKVHHSEYAAIRKRRGLLSVTEDDLRNLMRNLPADVRVFRDLLTIHDNRLHCLIHFGDQIP